MKEISSNDFNEEMHSTDFGTKIYKGLLDLKFGYKADMSSRFFIQKENDAIKYIQFGNLLCNWTYKNNPLKVRLSAELTDGGHKPGIERSLGFVLEFNKSANPKFAIGFGTYTGSLEDLAKMIYEPFPPGFENWSDAIIHINGNKPEEAILTKHNQHWFQDAEYKYITTGIALETFERIARTLNNGEPINLEYPQFGADIGWKK